MKHTYRASAEISLDALEHNIRQIRNIIGDDTKLMCVIKADAYGHGAVALADHMIEMGADSFAVATVEEGIELRENGINVPILILGHASKDQYSDIIQNDLIPTVYTYTMAKDLDIVANRMGKVADIEIKIDTGMNRIGFRVGEESLQSITMINSLLKNLKIHGIFTHFSCADTKNDEFTDKQAGQFESMLKALEERGVSIPCKHCSNSASIIKYPQLSMNMVRAGIIIYGLYPSDEGLEEYMSLMPVMSLKSHIVCIKTVEAGSPVGYGASFICRRPTRIATVSIGYADGYPRAMSNIGRVLINNTSYPIIGRVCMDQLMVDITDASNEISQCDEVILVGAQGTEKISVEEVADASASFNYEFICGIGRRVPRVYYKDGKVTKIVNYLLKPQE